MMCHRTRPYGQIFQALQNVSQNVLCLMLLFFLEVLAMVMPLISFSGALARQIT
jgi:hypothetical protein